MGDGWNTTYAVARQLAQPQLAVQCGDGLDVVLEGGNILIFGDDDVYPTADRDQFGRRLISEDWGLQKFSPDKAVAG